MTPDLRTLSRAAGDAGPAAPVRVVHLGLGTFFRAHQAWYTSVAPNAADWGIAAFTGGSPRLADQLTRQDGLYTLLVRGPNGDRHEVPGSICAAHPGTNLRAWRDYLARPAVRIVTLTVTEAGYLRGTNGRLDVGLPEVRADLEALYREPHAAVRTVPARLVTGLAARRAADAGPLAIVCCDDLPDNGAATAGVVSDFADLLEPSLADWISRNVSFVSTVADRLTVASTPQDARAVAERTGLIDGAPVVTEPYHEWVLSGQFPGGRPAWEAGGARFVGDIGPYERRKLWLLDGGHSLLAYTGGARGHETVAQAVADPLCRRWLEQWWTEAAAHLPMPAAEIAEYRQALLRRFANPRIEHRLAQIAADGSRKLPVRVLPVLRAERAAGRLPGATVRLLAAWIDHLRGVGTPVQDAAAGTVVAAATGPVDGAARTVLAALDGGLAADAALVAAIAHLGGRPGAAVHPEPLPVRPAGCR